MAAGAAAMRRAEAFIIAPDGWIGETMTANGGSPDKSGLMIGLGSIAAFLGVSEKQIYSFLRLGMPGNKINGVWYFHKVNVEKWWSAVTCGKAKLDENDQKEVVG